MAWMRMMGAESVAYHRATVLERGDDHPGQALAYYASRGETPLIWGGHGALGVGLSGAVDGDGYEAVFGPGGARHHVSGERLVSVRRPGMELVISAHKSVAELGVIGRAEDMHSIMDTERDATPPTSIRSPEPWADGAVAPRFRPQPVGWFTRIPGTQLAGPATRARTITCCWRTWSRCSTRAAGGRRPTPRCGGNTCTRRP